MAARRLITSLFLLFLCLQSIAVPPGFNDFLDSVEELLNDTERLMNANNPTVVSDGSWGGARGARTPPYLGTKRRND